MKINKQRLIGLAATGLIVAPIFASSIASAATSTISSAVLGQITAFTTSGTVAVNVSSTSGTKQTVNTDAVTISTNNAAGYTLKLEDGNASNDLCITPSGSCTGIPATSGTFATPALMSGINQWGYHIDGGAATKWCDAGNTCGATFGTTLSTSAAASTTLKFAGVPLSGSPDTLKTTATTAAGDVTNVWYGVNVDPTQGPGTYTDPVTYTATVNP